MSQDHRVLVELDAWQVHLSSGYHPLYDYAQQDALPHAEWQGSARRAFAQTILGAGVITEIDDAVVGASQHPKLIASRAADARLAAAWLEIPRVAGLDFDHESAVRAEYGVGLRVDGLAVQWAHPERGARSRVPQRNEVAARGHWVFAFDASHLPLICTDAGAPCEGLTRQAATLQLATQVLVFGCGGTPLDAFEGAPLRLRANARTHPLGEAMRVTGSHFTLAVDPQRGIVARS